MNREISLPFRVGADGGIATTSDPGTQGKQHLTTFLLTDPGERVMRPDFGTTVRHEVFENLDPLRAQLLATRLQDKVQENVRDVTLRAVTATEDSEQAALQVTVEFALAVGAGEGESRYTTISTGGGGL
jgi:uncharacterized protein